MNKRTALAIIDAERCFFPEKDRVEGFGALAVPDGHKVVAPINQLTDGFRQQELPIVHTLDKHIMGTAHFSENPNFINTWPVHGVDGTPGSLLHPDLRIAQDQTISKEFIKGDKIATSPEDDDSYTGALAHDRKTGELMPDFLRNQGVEKVVVAGLALGDGAEYKLCVDSTAADLHAQGFEVTVVTDAVEAVLPENREKCFRALGEIGIHLLTVAQALGELAEASHA